MAFDPKRHLMKVSGRSYLPVSARLIWFRSEHPDWGIVTAPVEINMEKQYAIFSCSIFNEEGKIMATATKMENLKGFADFIEKAETGSVGRALAYCGYGTQFAPELEEGRRLADAPYPPAGMNENRFGSSGGGSRPPMGNGNMGNGNMAGGSRDGYGNGNGSSMNRMPPPAQNARPQGNNAPPPTEMREPPRPAPAPARDDEDDDVFGDAPEPPRAAAPAPASRPSAAPPVNNNSGNNSGNNGGGVTRVREPERDFGDPGGDTDDDEDPFAEDDAPAPTPTRAAAPAANREPRPAPAEEAPAAPPKPNPMASGTRCSVEGCPNVLTASQATMSQNKFGRPLCLLHQKEAQPLATAGGAGARRGAKAGAGDGELEL